ncbi:MULTISPECIES: SDR family oxidoreductase [Cupriavidus]|uniref:SDR family oxidoreductase n=1 Tax=Cupriavidus TaxID=106589 RepID=UPI000E162962|nr:MULTISPECIES: SDR family oxidoreductase [Cupriavidus]MEC3767819.1 SDR family oxidoreductase [Cupriavidus sp. SS-3]SOY94920.1 hypothetical protein CBM2599_B30011 [Cupriavidus taiwanensis]SOY98755.1 hypothetical protein CBM2600_B30265 [Cupriavidus taiwanensis]
MSEHPGSLGKFPTASLYTLTKGAIAGFNRSLVRDLGPKGITVNTVHPGPTDTDMNPAGGPVSEIVGPGIALGRYGQPHEIAGVVAFLAGPDAACIQAVVANSRGPETLRDAVKAIGPSIRPGTREEAAAQEIVLVAVNWSKLPQALGGLPDFGGRIVIDANNPIEAPLFRPADLHGRSSSELFADLVPGA